MPDLINYAKIQSPASISLDLWNCKSQIEIHKIDLLGQPRPDLCNYPASLSSTTSQSLNSRPPPLTLPFLTTSSSSSSNPSISTYNFFSFNQQSKKHILNSSNEVLLNILVNMQPFLGGSIYLQKRLSLTCKWITHFIEILPEQLYCGKVFSWPSWLFSTTFPRLVAFKVSLAFGQTSLLLLLSSMALCILARPRSAQEPKSSFLQPIIW